MRTKEKQEQLNAYWSNFVSGVDREKAFSRIYDLNIHDLLAYGCSLGFDEETCKDVAHDLFFRLFQDAGRSYEIGNITVYLFGSFRNRLISTGLRNTRLKDVKIEELPFATEVTILDTLTNEEDRALLRDNVAALLRELTPRQREAIYLRYMQNMAYDDIARLLEMTNGSVRKLVYRALETMRRKASEMDMPLVVVMFLAYLRDFS
ncbi:RNA polymerase sigma factor [Prevotella sp. kh1p2]|uniref:RNA polymerase sigma factor n=1 Tax=Prevotella sp. kh1p2 TaxID=1761883 RepID=UPI0008C63920|nr:RNA polymerase sigma factor [Prevotella sp. kh1p2]SET16146.1 RNA polymerase sigma factor, sigma-70 family [Prevotella sp. kh1p2]SNU12091.1 RNA polymerase sigma factor, sigma-70 family [Prevotellaceae bacterium KH2P17]